MAKTLTAEMVILGSKFTKTVKVQAYGGAEVEIRPVQATVLYKVLDKMTKGAGGVTVDPVELEGLPESERLAKFMDMGISLDAVADAMLLLCETGIADEKLAAVIKDDRLGAVMEIGTAIMDLSSGDDKAVLDFIEARMASSSPEPEPQGT